MQRNQAVASASSPRIGYLREASTSVAGVKGCLVKEVFRKYLPLECIYLAKKGLLEDDFAKKMTTAFGEAAKACDSGGGSCSNSAGSIPRAAAQNAGMDRSDLEKFIDVLAAARVDDDLANGDWCLYGERGRERDKERGREGREREREEGELNIGHTPQRSLDTTILNEKRSAEQTL